MTLHFASLLPAFLALASVSQGVYAQPLEPLGEPVVEYTFDDNMDRTKNTGTGDTVDFSTLDGVLFPAENNGITFLEDDASFSGRGCIEIPKSQNMNKGFQSRTISLDFIWDGSSNPNNEPQVLFDAGGTSNGVNIVISSTDSSAGTAELVMGVWEELNKPELAQSLFIDKPINANTWYSATFQIRRTCGKTWDGRGCSTVAGYLNGDEFDFEEIEWGGIRQHSNPNCIGGVREHTRIFNGTASDYAVTDGGLYFRGQVDNFKLYTSKEIPEGQTRSLRGNHDQ